MYEDTHTSCIQFQVSSSFIFHNQVKQDKKYKTKAKYNYLQNRNTLKTNELIISARYVSKQHTDKYKYKM